MRLKLRSSRVSNHNFCGIFHHLLLAFFFLYSPPLRALDHTRAISQYVHDVWTSDQGLPQNSVFSVTQTRDGYLWLATAGALVRFDGIQFTVISRNNTEGIKDNRIGKVRESRDGSLWIGSNQNGLYRLKDGKWNNYSTKDGLSNNSVRSIYEDRQGNLWIGTERGLNRIQGETLSIIGDKDGPPNSFVYDLLEDRQANLWVATRGDGLYSIRNGKWSRYSTKDGLSSNFVWSLVEDHQGNVWAGTRDGLSLFRNGIWRSYTTKDGLSNDGVLSLLEDREGNLWIGTNGGGLSRFRDGIWKHYTTEDGLSNDFVWSLYEDREGSLWVGTDGGGLNRFRDGKLTTYTSKEGLSANHILCIYEDHEGSLWIGTNGGGLNRFKDGKWNSYTTRDGLSDNDVWSIYQDRQGNLWIGTEGGGLNRFLDGKWDHYTTRDGLSDDDVWSIYQDRHGDLWVGTERGLNRLRNGRWIHYTTKDGLSSDIVYSILEDRHGDLWIGTRIGGLNRLHDGKWQSFTTKEGLSFNDVWSLYEDRDGNLWIGTESGGLNLFKNGRFVHYTTKEGLFDDVVYQILEDNKQNLWMSGHKGIFQVSKADLKDFADGKIKNVHSSGYGKADGMRSQECTGGQLAGYKTRDGRLWFPTIKGAVVIDPEKIKENELPPPIILEKVKADDQVVWSYSAPGTQGYETGQARVKSETRVDAGRQRFEFQYTALSFAIPERVKCKYRLDGFDKDWVDAGIRRTAYYTNLPPGNYTFKVVGCNEDGVWNHSGAVLAFTLSPQFYQTWWFKFGNATLLIILMYSAFRIRLRKIEARNRELRKEVEQRKEAEHMFRAVLESAPDAMVITDGKGRILLANTQAEQLFLYTGQELLASSVEKLVPGGLGLHPMNSSSVQELRGVRKSGEEFPIDITVSPIETKDGIMKIAAIRDITERKLTEQFIRRSEENYRRLFEESKDVVFISTPGGKVVDINQAGVDLFGYPSKEAMLEADINRDFFVNPGDREKYVATMEMQGYVKDFELIMERKDGERIIVQETSTAVRDEKGNIVAYRGLMRDVTHMKQLQEQLLQSQKIEMIGRLAGGVAHDFNNILMAISSYSELLLFKLAPDDPLRKDTLGIQKAAQQGASLTQQLLAFSRKQILTPKVVDLDGVVSRMDGLLRRLIGEHIDLRTSLDPDLGRVMVDPSQIEQVIMNLVVNARDAMPTGGKLFLETSNVRLEENWCRNHPGSTPGCYVMLTVTDSGCGIDEATISRIFEPFFTTKGPGKGTGLGLSTVFGIVKQSEGYITVESRQGQGSTFRIYLPRFDEPVETPLPTASAVVAESGEETILLVDDNELLRGAVSAFLTLRGYTVLQAGSGHEAVELIRIHKGPIHLVITDVVMPQMSGMQLVQQICSQRPATKVLYMSGYAEEAIVRQGALEPGTTFLTKPLSMVFLLNKIREML